MFMKICGVPRARAAATSWWTTSKSPLAMAPATMTEGVTASLSGGSDSPTRTVSKLIWDIAAPLACEPGNRTRGERTPDVSQYRARAPQAHFQLLCLEEVGLHRVLDIGPQAT